MKQLFCSFLFICGWFLSVRSDTTAKRNVNVQLRAEWSSTPLLWEATEFFSLDQYALYLNALMNHPNPASLRSDRVNWLFCFSLCSIVIAPSSIQRCVILLVSGAI